MSDDAGNHAPLRSERPKLGRRQLAKAAAASVPAVAFGASMRGYQEGQAQPLVRTVEMAWTDLAPELDGLTILQLSDVHLGLGRKLRDLETFLESLPARPDLVVLTGDIADDLRLLEPALRMVKDLGARHGAFSVLGNHEHFHGAEAARKAHRRAGVPILTDEGGLVHVGGAKLWIAGADDPVRLHGDLTRVFEDRVRRAMNAAPSSGFRLLLSHRPEGFRAGAAHGVHLTLSGHTHGGQVGFNGKSAFEAIWPERYLWGTFRRGDAQLYTTSGFGHWFPFRIGCPTEAPLVRLLRRAPIDGTVASTSRAHAGGTVRCEPCEGGGARGFARSASG